MAAVTRDKLTDEGYKWLLVGLAIKGRYVTLAEAATSHGISVRQLKRKLIRIEDAVKRIHRDEIRVCERPDCEAVIPADSRSDRFYCYPAAKCRTAGWRGGGRVRGRVDRRTPVERRRYTAAERKALRDLDREFGF